MSETNMSTWIYSLGGPLLLLPEHLQAHWHGTDKLDTQMISDYERSCSIADYLGTLDVKGEQVVVLGDEPAQTTWIPGIGFQGVCLIRWRYAPDYQTVIQLCNEIDYTAFPSYEKIISLKNKKLFVMDAAFPGEQINWFPQSFLKISLRETGKYGISTFHFRPNETVWLIIHKLEKATDLPG